MLALFHEGSVEADKNVYCSVVKYIIKGMKVKKLKKKSHKSRLRLGDASTRKRPQILSYAS